MSSEPEPTVRPATVTFPEALRAAAENRAEFLVADQDTQVIGYAYVARMPTLFAGGTVLEMTVPTRRAADFYRRLDFTETATYLKWSSPPRPSESPAPAR
ncbi:hypothetical protein ABTZ93_08815 [Streptomyces sp. NPDC097941]|uniref:hypothetical protein n=1 Tax=Streptomyces sp. NPDC097941 TaxID=3155685 RepID=UPI003333302E